MTTPPLMTKTALMARVIAGHNLECFEHSHWGMINITAMRALAQSGGALDYVLIPLNLICDHIRATRVIEEQRILDLGEGSWRQDPVMFLVNESPEVPGGLEHTMIDGHHRALRAEREGMAEIHAYVFHHTSIIRPPRGWGKRADMDWGDDYVNGQIVKRT